MGRLTPVPFNTPPYKNVDPLSNTTLGDDLINGWLDESSSLQRRYGCQNFITLPTPGGKESQSGFWWEKKQLLITIANGRVFKIINKDGDYVELTGATLPTGNPITFATSSTGEYLVMAGGDRMVYTDGATTCSYITDPDAPNRVAFVAFLDQYIIAAQKGTGLFKWSAVGNPIDWDTLDFATAESNSDDIQALVTNTREVIIFGTQSVEFWASNVDTPGFTRIQGATDQVGTYSPYSVCLNNGTIYFLDNEKRLRQYNPGSHVSQIISTPFDKVIANFSVVSDCRIWAMTTQGRNWLILQFPSENKTLFFDYLTKQWGEWSTWNSFSSSPERWLGNWYVRSIPWDLEVIGDYRKGAIYKISPDVYMDIEEPIVLTRVTGHIDHGTPAQKQCDKLIVKVKRGAVLTETEPVFTLRYKDNNEVGWSNPIEGSLGMLGDTFLYVYFQPLGVYWTRQYEISISDPVPFVLVSAHEDLHVEET